MEPMVRCPHCGLYHNATIEYCPEKGLPIYQPKAVEIHSKPNLLWLVIVVALLLTALCAVSAIYFIPNFLESKIIPNNQVPVSVPTLTLEPIQTRISELFTPTIEVTNTPPEPTATLIPTDSAWQACEDVEYPSHLHTGMQASVALDPPLPNRVREDPSTNAKILGYVDPGGKVEILEGPSCQEGWIWWRVKEISTDLTGWTAEGNKDGYWLIPD